MIRKLNYTNRVKVERETISISLVSAGAKTSFNAVFDKENLKFPDEASIYIEPYYGPNYLRFSFGTIGDIKQPPDTDITELRQFSEKLYFRIKIVDDSKVNGLLLGFADKLPLSDENDPSNRSSIFYVNPVEMDTNEVWRINFEADSEGMPVLEVNNSIEGIKELAKTDWRFIALVFPMAIREILNRIIEQGLLDDDSGWSSKWIKFTEGVLGVTNTPAGDDTDEMRGDWVNDCVRAFCRSNKVLENYIKLIQ